MFFTPKFWKINIYLEPLSGKIKIQSLYQPCNGSVFYKLLDSEDDFAERADHIDDVLYLHDVEADVDPAIPEFT